MYQHFVPVVRLAIFYVVKSLGKFVGGTSCEKMPVELCGEGRNCNIRIGLLLMLYLQAVIWI